VAGLAALAGGVAAHAVRLLGVVSGCTVSFADTRTVPLALIIPAALGLASLGGFTRAFLSYWRERQVLRSLPLAPVATSELADMARTVRMPLYQTPAARPAAFCFGLLSPRIVLTSGLIERLSGDESAAAFWHEAQHARVREPLRTLLARLTANTFFWLPALRDLFERYTLARELDADRLAESRTSRSALAGALHAVAAGQGFAGSVGFADMAAARVDRLLDPKMPLPSLFRRSRLALTLGAVALLTAAFTYPANVPVSTHEHQATMMMRVPVTTPAGVKWILVRCG
jgi:beta-lactamase regulating signal transducer with metallopeptidase domain